MNTRYAHTVGMLFAASLLSACAVQPEAPDPAALQQAYQTAVKDAEQATPAEVSKNLTALVPSNPDLVWKDKDSRNRALLVATWTNYDGYDQKIGKSMRLSREVWVTAVPEVKKFCQQIRGDKNLRLEQLLGLPPNAGKTKFVEMWVKPADLFRPSADPEISDNQAEIDLRTPNEFVPVSSTHTQWFRDLKQHSYGAKGYPWTRLGYTYDWGNPGNKVGASEFVIMKNAAIAVHAVTPTQAYCQ